MKKLSFLFVLVLVSFCLQAQSPIGITFESTGSLRQFADSIALNAQRPFDYTSEGVSTDNPNYYVLTYANKGDATDIVRVVFRIEADGANTALETDGKTSYTFYGTSGKFLDIFPFWSKFIDPSADPALAGSFHEYKKELEGFRFTLKDTGTTWRMDCKRIRN